MKKVATKQDTCSVCNGQEGEIYIHTLSEGYRIRLSRSIRYCSKDKKYICWDCCIRCSTFIDSNGKLLCKDKTLEEISRQKKELKESERQEELRRISAGYHENRRLGQRKLVEQQYE